MSTKNEETSQPEKILQAAFKCISQNGYANVSLRDIADEANVILSQINYYYKNKEGLFIEVVKSLTNQHLKEMESFLSTHSTTSEKMTSLSVYFKDTLLNKPEVFKVLFDLTSMALWSPSLKELVNSLFRDMVEVIDKQFSQNFAHDSKLSKQSSLAVSRLLLGTYLGITFQSMFSDNIPEYLDSLSILNSILD